MPLMTHPLNQLRPNAYILRLSTHSAGFSAVVIVLESGTVFEFSSLEALQAFIQAQVQDSSAPPPLAYPESDDPRR